MIYVNSECQIVKSNPDFPRRVAALDQHNLDVVKKRLKEQHLWLEDSAEHARIGFVRFAALTMITEEVLVPTIEVDEFWHSFLLFTSDYQKWCKMHWGGDFFFHHVPGHKEDDGSWERTCSLIKDVFDVEWNPTVRAFSCYTPPPQSPSRCWSEKAVPVDQRLVARTTPLPKS